MNQEAKPQPDNQPKERDVLFVMIDGELTKVREEIRIQIHRVDGQNQHLVLTPAGIRFGDALTEPVSHSSWSELAMAHEAAADAAEAIQRNRMSA